MSILSKPEILITKKFPDQVVLPLRKIAIVHEWDGHSCDLMPREEVIKFLPRLSGIINQAELNADKELLEKGTKLKIIANVSLGFDNLELELMTARGIWASNTPGFFDYPVVEYTIGGIITVFRRLLEADRFVRSGSWKEFQPGRWDGENLSGKTLGIIGMGSIGESLARVASCLGMNIIYYNRSKSSMKYQWVPLHDLLSSADVISLNVPYSRDTHGMIAASEFRQMKPGVLFVNTSRGKVVNETDLVEFLKNGHISGAVLDVFEHEPAVPEPLKSMANVLLTPHIAGGTRRGRIQCYRLAVENVLNVLQGRDPLNPLNSISRNL